MEVIRNIIREEIKVILNSDKEKQIDFGPALVTAIETLIEIQTIVKGKSSIEEKLEQIDNTLNKFF
ncbi:MAG: hypothetical protein QE487_06735 [Fluviicola sp.]|nr:hypothetical protein [Fluviicola sp.]